MTKGPLFLALLLCSFAVAAVRAGTGDAHNEQDARIVADKLRHALRRLDEYIQRNRPIDKQNLKMLSQLKERASIVIGICEEKNVGYPLIDDSIKNKLAMYELKRMIKKNCTTEPNAPFHYFHAVKNHHGAILYTLIPMGLEQYEQLGYKPGERQTYNLRSKLCRSLCRQTYVVNVHHPSEIKTLQKIFKAYNAEVQIDDPKLRQYDIGFHFLPGGRSIWHDATRYNEQVWPGFPRSMPTLNENSCVSLDVETGKPVMGNCSLLYDVVVCEQRCKDC